MTFFRNLKVGAVVAGAAIIVVSVAAGAVSAASAHPTIVERTTVAAANGPVVVAIGDSIMEGHGLEPSQAWPALLAEENGWRLTNLASDGSGFVTVGDNGDTFDDQVTAAAKLHPAIVLLSGSSNDLGVADSAITTATTATVDRLRADLPNAEIIAVSPVWNDKSVPPQLLTIDADTVSAVAGVQGRNLEIGQPLFGQPSLMQGDDVHPTADGQQVLATAIENALVGAGSTP
ncbi:SGNH/GDSL hydrolase family protein [Leifsonia poae]|uniref:SGNH/GDSL hydrolase family protein n=1 Tax=Leifsonia poae TaxID=110933 RepID=UPI001CBB174B|nr:SGNH/GDSL hydrolase family protein [Leifsonia poae]